MIKINGIEIKRKGIIYTDDPFIFIKKYLNTKYKKF